MKNFFHTTATVVLLQLFSVTAFTTKLIAGPKYAKYQRVCLRVDSEEHGEKGGINKRTTRARDLIRSLVEDKKCFSTTTGAIAFGGACAQNIVYEDCYEPQPIVGRLNVQNHMIAKVESRKGKGDLRVDKISDGSQACGFAWTWTSAEMEGLRGTCFVELNDNGEIQYVREIPEPIFKPGDLTLELLKAVTKDAQPNELIPFEKRIPSDANDIVKYLFTENAGQDIDDSMKLFSENILYRDFNFENILKGKSEVKKFIEDFSFPGITFRPQRFDDGILSTCLTWEVVLMDAPDTIKGISFYEIDPESRLITYVRDVPESAIKPPILGKLARQLRPGLGYFQGVKIGSRPGGL